MVIVVVKREEMESNVTALLNYLKRARWFFMCRMFIVTLAQYI